MTDFSIVYNRGGFKLTAFSDTNWGNNSDNGKPMSLYIMMMASAPVSFKAGIQMLTGVLTMEAELVAAALAIKEIAFCSSGTRPTVLAQSTWPCGSPTSVSWSRRARSASTTYQVKSNSPTLGLRIATSNITGSS